jgi:hypothetical protein
MKWQPWTLRARNETEIIMLRRENAQLRADKTALVADVARFAEADGRKLGVLQAENERLRAALTETLEELQLDDSRHDLQAKILLAIRQPDETGERNGEK